MGVKWVTKDKQSKIFVILTLWDISSENGKHDFLSNRKIRFCEIHLNSSRNFYPQKFQYRILEKSRLFWKVSKQNLFIPWGVLVCCYIFTTHLVPLIVEVLVYLLCAGYVFWRRIKEKVGDGADRTKQFFQKNDEVDGVLSDDE